MMKFLINKRKVSSESILIRIPVFKFLLFSTSCLGWGDVLAGKKHVIGNYWLLENESGSFELYYCEGGDYIGRSPKFVTVIEYGIEDSVLLFVSKSRDAAVRASGINMKTDHKFADKYLIDQDLTTKVYQRLMSKNGLHKIE